MANEDAEQPPKMKLAVLTSGGDSAGMNAVVRAVVKAGILRYGPNPRYTVPHISHCFNGFS